LSHYHAEQLISQKKKKTAVQQHDEYVIS